MNNSLIEATRIGRPPVYWRTALYFIVVEITGNIVGALFAAPFVVAALLVGVTNQEDLIRVAWVPGTVFGGLWMVGVTVGWVYLIDRRPITSIGLRTRRPFGEWLRGMGMGAGLMLVSVGLMAVFGTIQVAGDPLDSPSRLLGVAGLLAFFLIQGPIEEVVFRGYLLPMLGARGNMVLGVVVSSILFGSLHAFNPNFGVLPLVNIVLAGVLFALYALLEEGLWGVFGVHSAWNWVQGNVLGLPVSGGDFGPSLPRLREAGPDWLTGGAFGPEGSVVVTLLLAAVSAGLGWRLWRRRKTQRHPEGVGG